MNWWRYIRKSDFFRSGNISDVRAVSRSEITITDRPGRYAKSPALAVAQMHSTMAK